MAPLTLAAVAVAFMPQVVALVLAAQAAEVVGEITPDLVAQEQRTLEAAAVAQAPQSAAQAAALVATAALVL